MDLPKIVGAHSLEKKEISKVVSSQDTAPSVSVIGDDNDNDNDNDLKGSEKIKDDNKTQMDPQLLKRKLDAGNSEVCHIDSEKNRTKRRTPTPATPKDKTPKLAKQVPNKDHYERISHLFQASRLMAVASPDMECLSRMYAQTFATVAKKNVLRISPTIKRAVCKSCSRQLIAGVNCQIRVENKSKKGLDHCDVLVYKCQCGGVKRFPVGKNRDYVVWSERDEVVQGITN